MIEEIWFEANKNFAVSNKGNIKSLRTGKLVNKSNIRVGNRVLSSKSFVIETFNTLGLIERLDPLFLLHGNCKEYLIRTPQGETLVISHLKTFCEEYNINYRTVITRIHRGKAETKGYKITKMN